MTCRDFQRKWDELLDEDARRAVVADVAETAPPGAAGRRAEEGEALLIGHAAGCPDCRPIADRYQVLRHAIRAWRQPPVPPADLVDRILSTTVEPTIGSREAGTRRARRAWLKHRPNIAIASGLAASLLVAVLMGLSLHRSRRGRADRLDTPTQTAQSDMHSVAGSDRAPDQSTALNRALAEATSATWDLARSASEPAARISRDVLDATTQGDPRPDEALRGASPMAPAGTTEGLAILSVSVPSLDPLAPDALAASAVLQQVGDRLSTGVQPLSSTARHAFGFLLGPRRDRTESRTNGRTARGA
jgi:hypothetical protein